MRKFIGIILIIIGLGIAAFVFYTNSTYSTVTRQFSPYTLLTSSWEKYKQQFINTDGRVIDYSQQGITTSEGQSYALLRAVWVDDKETFDKVWKWTKENLDRPGDNLFGWRWGQRDDTSYGFMPGGGENSASDADQDIALALILASSRWGQESYLAESKKILPDLWRLNTGTALGKRYLTAGNWAMNSQELVINPSYFAPYAWRIFAKVDTSRDWNSLISPAYDLLDTVGTLPLDKEKGVGLPPDWIAIKRNTGAIVPTEIENFTTNYSYDAVRVPWKIALDYRWNTDPRAKAYLTKSFAFINNQYTRDKKLASSYQHDGTVAQEYENPTMYATIIGYFITLQPKLAKKMYEEKIVRLYANDQSAFREDLPYYEQNWLWFGAAFYNDFLRDYTK